MGLGRSFSSLVAMAAMLSSCGGGGGSSGGGTSISPAPPPTSSACSLRSRQDFAFASLNENYLFPETLPSNTDPTP